MASNINYTSIDETFPIAGKDNDTQGFRDNFGYVKNSLQAAKSEIEDLQLNTAKTNADNDFNNNTISQATFQNCADTLYDGTIVASNTLLQYSAGSIQIFEVTNSITFTLSDFPASGTAGYMKLQVTSDGNSHNLTFNVSGGGTIKKSSRVPGTITVTSSSNPVIFEFWSYNGGTTIFMDYLGSFS